MKKLYNLKELLSSLLFYLSILLFLIGFNFTDTSSDPATDGPPSGWYQQWMPNLNGMPVSDIYFLDSLTGWSVTGTNSGPGHVNYILKTTNGGDNWNIIFTDTSFFSKVKFINYNTGYSSGGSGGGTGYLYKTTNGGDNWIKYVYGIAELEDMAVLNKDTLWVVDHDPLTGGVYLTTNGGLNWNRQLYLGNQNPSKIYMHDADTGFVEGNGHGLYRTTNGGLDWTYIETNNYAFYNMYFTDGNTGWKSNGFMKKTTNGGQNWVTETLPGGGIVQTSVLSRFSVVNKDTIWGNGGYVLYPNNQTRWLLHRTTDGGNTWLFQIPDTSIHITYYYINFVNKLKGWATDQAPTEIHTVTGGNDTFYTSTKQTSSIVPNKFELFPNRPNPFNPVTHIKYSIGIPSGQIIKSSYVKLIVYDITGKEVKTLVNQKQSEGTYEVTFDGTGYSSGVYFYSLYVYDPVSSSGPSDSGGILVDTKKMVLLK
jgi:photosystem II stability/assembly factor-like uncharacterized protein